MTTYTTIWRLAAITPLDPAVKNSWGTIQDATMPLMEQGAVGITSVNIAGLTTYSLTTANNASDQARYLVQQYTGALTADCTVTLPNVSRVGWARNSTTGGHNVILSSGAGTTATIPPDGATYFFTTDGSTNTAIVAFGLGQATVGGAFTVNGNATFNGGTNVFNGALSVQSLNVMAALAVTGDISTAGATNHFAGATTLDAATVSGNLAVGGSQTVGTSLTVSGDVAFNGSGVALYVPNGNSVFNILQTSGAQSVSVSGWALTSSGTGPTTNNYNIGITASGSSMLAANFFAVSDGDLKIDVEDIRPEDGVAWVEASRPVSYRKLGRFGDAPETAMPEAGFIAQEQARDGYSRYVALVPSEGMPARPELELPEDVMLALPEGYKVAYLTAAVKYLLGELAILKAKSEP